MCMYLDYLNVTLYQAPSLKSIGIHSSTTYGDGEEYLNIISVAYQNV
jgi:hypothetical protein